MFWETQLRDKNFCQFWTQPCMWVTKPLYEHAYWWRPNNVWIHESTSLTIQSNSNVDRSVHIRLTNYTFLFQLTRCVLAEAVTSNVSFSATPYWWTVAVCREGETGLFSAFDFAPPAISVRVSLSLPFFLCLSLFSSSPALSGLCLPVSLSLSVCTSLSLRLQLWLSVSPAVVSAEIIFIPELCWECSAVRIGACFVSVGQWRDN